MEKFTNSDLCQMLKSKKEMVKQNELETIKLKTENNYHEKEKHNEIQIIEQVKQEERNVNTNVGSIFDDPPKNLETNVNDSVEKGNIESLRYLIDVANESLEIDHPEKQTLLHIACIYGHIPIIQYLVKKGFDINAPSTIGETPLHIACSNGHLSAVRYIIETLHASTDSVDKDGYNALHFAAKNGHVPVVKYLIEKVNISPEIKTNNNSTSLHLAIENNRLDVIKYLISLNVDLSVRNKSDETPLTLASRSNNQLVFDYFREKYRLPKDLKPNLIEACKTGQYESVVYQVEALNANLNETELDDKPIHIAAKNGHTKIVQYLIECAHENIESKGNGNSTPLISACDSGSLNVVKYLISKGANINATDITGTTPLIRATKSHHPDVVKYLIDNGAYLNTIDNLGQAAIHYAVNDKSFEIVKYLVDAKANLEIATEGNYYTPLHYAAMSDCTEIARYLIDNGANKYADAGYKTTPYVLARTADMKKLLQ